MIGSQIGDQSGKTTEPFDGSALLLFAIIWNASVRRLDGTLTDL
jgi:hypothetical protein